ncbi:unnamed protein product [Discula destructiva]
MATHLGATTPTRSRSPVSRINTPPTPRLGTFNDNWEPYSPARKSARISSRINGSDAITNTDTRTPSPNSSARISRSSHPRPLANTSAPRTVDSQSQPSHPSHHNTSPSATLSPQKKRQPASASAHASRAVSGSLTAQSIRDAAAALGQTQQMDSLAASRAAALALPTPAKTPARANPEQTDKEVTAIARNLFGSSASASASASSSNSNSSNSNSSNSKDQAAPLSIKKTRSKRTTGISLDSFEIRDEEAPIEIFTDSENRLPEADGTAENPFFGESGIAASAVPVRRSARNKKNAAVEKEFVEEKLKREDGLLYVFRGKKVFRKFTDADAASRSAVMPRLLFPTAAKAGKQTNVFTEEEEAETDIEEQEQITPRKAAAVTETEKEPETPAETAETAEQDLDTPKAPKHAPASPPSTSRATRSKKLIIDEHTPVKSKGKRVASGGRSPFDGWRRTKNSPSSSTSRKRAGDPLTSDASKRSKA